MYIGPWQEWRLAQRLAELDNNVRNRPHRRLRRNQRQIDPQRKDSSDSEKLPLIEQDRGEDKLPLTRFTTTTTTPTGVKSRKNCNGFSRHLESYCETVIPKKAFDLPSGSAKLNSKNDDTLPDNDNVLESRNKRKKKSKPAKNKARRRKQLGLQRVQKMKRMYSNVSRFEQRTTIGRHETINIIFEKVFQTFSSFII